MILVVGGAGFIGSHMVKRLLSSGEKALVLDNFERGHKSALLGCRYVTADLRDPRSIGEALRDYDIEAVLHFAAYIEVGESVKEPGSFWLNNVGGTLNLIAECQRRGIDQFVFSSTAAVYGSPQTDSIDESHPTVPTNPYGQTKLAVERAIDDLESNTAFRSVRLRYFNASGADPEGELGEDHRPETHLLPRLIFAGLGRSPFTVFGDDYPTRDGTCVRDYIHVCDLVEAHLGALRLLRRGGTGTYNLGNGTGHSVKEIVEAAYEVFGNRFEVGYGPRRPGDPPTLVASSAKAHAELAWKPQYPDVRTMIQHAKAWFEAHPNGYPD